MIKKKFTHYSGSLQHSVINKNLHLFLLIKGDRKNNTVVIIFYNVKYRFFVLADTKFKDKNWFLLKYLAS